MYTLYKLIYTLYTIILYYIYRYDQATATDSGADNTTTMTIEKAKTIKSLINLCKVVVVVLDRSYLSNECCLYEVRQARQAAPAKPIIVS